MGREIKWKYEIGQVIKDEKRYFKIIEKEIRCRQRKTHKENQKWYKCKCNVCSGEVFLEENHLHRGRGCPCCDGRVIIKGINDISTLRPDLNIFFVDINDSYNYGLGSHKEVKCKCPMCGEIKNIKIYNLTNKGFVCKKCNINKSSLPEKIMNYVLKTFKESNYIDDYDTEKVFDWCKFYNPYKKIETFGRYDFVIEKNKIIIEMDGRFHKNYNEMNGQSVEESKFIDNIKDKLAKDNGFKVIRIDCNYKNNEPFTFIKNNIIKSDLKNYFKINTINWDICLKYINNYSDNILNSICEYWNNNKNKTVSDLALYFNKDRETIRKNLKIGSDIGLCNYNVYYEISKNGKKSSEKLKIFIKVIKNENIILVEKGLNNLSRKSSKCLGINISPYIISKCINGKMKDYKGFLIEKTTEKEYMDFKNKGSV